MTGTSHRLPLGMRLERWGLIRLDDLAHRLQRKPKPRHLRVGERGELEALFFLRRQGFLVVERRWRTPEWNGDLDLVAWEGETLCIVEVKTRTARDRTPAGSAVDETKRKMLLRLSRAFVKLLPRDDDHRVPVRFDLVSVYLLPGGTECELLRGAFTGDDVR